MANTCYSIANAEFAHAQQYYPAAARRQSVPRDRLDQRDRSRHRSGLGAENLRQKIETISISAMATVRSAYCADR
jgi:hypothetical protein